MNRILRRCSMLVVPLVLAAVPARAQEYQDPNDWAKKMFDTTEKNFGVVARGAEVTHRFRIKNLYKEDIRVANVTTSCGCTAPKFDQTPVKAGGETYLDISMDTNRFQHEKSSTVTVTFDQPRYATVAIPVKVYIRSDVVLTPGSINFGAVGTGEKLQRKIDIAYAGRPNWKIVKVIPGSPYIDARVVETSRDNASTVAYSLEVNLLPNTPVGLLRKQLTLVTDDETGSDIPVNVQARVEGDVTITPSVVQLGTVAPGLESTKTVLLRGQKPFVIEKVECESNLKAFKMPILSKDSRAVHVLSLSFTAPAKVGPFTEKFIVTITGRPEPISFTATGTIEDRTALPNAAQTAR